MATTGRITAWSETDPPRPGVPLLEALELPRMIGVSRAYAVAVVGAGGKTSVIHSLATEFATLGARVAVTTTTHMAVEHELVTDVDEAVRRLGSPGVVLAGVPVGNGRFGRFPDGDAQRLRTAADVLLVEADGSKRLPFKVPAPHEPAIPPYADRVLVVQGLSAVGRPVGEVCFRAELVPAVLGRAAPATLDPATAAALIRAGYLDNPKLVAWTPARLDVILNQADDQQRCDVGREIAAALPGAPVILTTREPAAS